MEGRTNCTFPYTSNSAQRSRSPRYRNGWDCKSGKSAAKSSPRLSTLTPETQPRREFEVAAAFSMPPSTSHKLSRRESSHLLLLMTHLGKQAYPWHTGKVGSTALRLLAFLVESCLNFLGSTALRLLAFLVESCLNFLNTV